MEKEGDLDDGEQDRYHFFSGYLVPLLVGDPNASVQLLKIWERFVDRVFLRLLAKLAAVPFVMPPQI